MSTTLSKSPHLLERTLVQHFSPECGSEETGQTTKGGWDGYLVPTRLVPHPPGPVSTGLPSPRFLVDPLKRVRRDHPSSLVYWKVSIVPETSSCSRPLMTNRLVFRSRRFRPFRSMSYGSLGLGNQVSEQVEPVVTRESVERGPKRPFFSVSWSLRTGRYPGLGSNDSPNQSGSDSRVSVVVKEVLRQVLEGQSRQRGKSLLCKTERVS